MVEALRKAYNSNFSVEQYQRFIEDLNSYHKGAIEFKVAETPIFIDKEFTQKLIDACESIVDVITDPAFFEMTDRSIPKTEQVPNETRHAHMIAFDFGICINENRELE